MKAVTEILRRAAAPDPKLRRKIVRELEALDRETCGASSALLDTLRLLYLPKHQQ